LAVGWLGWRGAYAAPIALLGLTLLSLLPARGTAPAGPQTATVGWGTYRRLLGEARIWRLGLAHAGSFGVFIALGSWLSTLYLRATGGNQLWSAELAAVVLLLSGVARLGGSPAAARFG